MKEDRRRFNGGHKTAGRKSKAEELKLIEKLSPLDDKAFELLEEGLNEGNYKYLQLFFNYRFGKAPEFKNVSYNADDTIVPTLVRFATTKEIENK